MKSFLCAVRIQSRGNGTSLHQDGRRVHFNAAAELRPIRLYLGGMVPSNMQRASVSTTTRSQENSKETLTENPLNLMCCAITIAEEGCFEGTVLSFINLRTTRSGPPAHFVPRACARPGWGHMPWSVVSRPRVNLLHVPPGVWPSLLIAPAYGSPRVLHLGA
jgi:hypothetical protein